MKLDKPADGLLGALNLKVFGRNPPDFAEQVVPTYDVRDYYLARQVTSFTATANGPLAAFTVQTITVPAGKCWHVYQIGLGIGTGVVPAAQMYDAQFFARRAQQPLPIGLGQILIDSANLPSLVGASTFLGRSVTFNPPLLLYGGDTVQAYNQIAIPAAGSSIRVTVAAAETDF